MVANALSLLQDHWSLVTLEEETLGGFEAEDSRGRVRLYMTPRGGYLLATQARLEGGDAPWRELYFPTFSSLETYFREASKLGRP